MRGWGLHLGPARSCDLVGTIILTVGFTLPFTKEEAEGQRSVGPPPAREWAGKPLTSEASAEGSAVMTNDKGTTFDVCSAYRVRGTAQRVRLIPSHLIFITALGASANFILLA